MSSISAPGTAHAQPGNLTYFRCILEKLREHFEMAAHPKSSERFPGPPSARRYEAITTAYTGAAAVRPSIRSRTPP